MYDEKLVHELCQFLFDDKSEVRAIAMNHVNSIIVDKTGREYIKTQKNVIECMMKLSLEDIKLTAHEALVALINLTQEESMRQMMMEELSESSLAWIISILNKILKADNEWALINLGSMVLANMTQEESTCKLIENVFDISLFMKVFIHGKNMYSKHTHCDYLGLVLANMSRLPFIRSQLVNHERPWISDLLLQLSGDSMIRRGGIVATIKNCCFEIDQHEWLLSPQVDLQSYLLLPLMGPEDELTEEDKNGMPEQLLLRYSSLKTSSPTNQREPDIELRKILVECLFLLTSQRKGRDYLRAKKTYPIMRELHKNEPNDVIQETICSVVDMLLRDEADAQPLSSVE